MTASGLSGQRSPGGAAGREPECAGDLSQNSAGCRASGAKRHGRYPGDGGTDASGLSHWAQSPPRRRSAQCICSPCDSSLASRERSARQASVRRSSDQTPASTKDEPRDPASWDTSALPLSPSQIPKRKRQAQDRTGDKPALLVRRGPSRPREARPARCRVARRGGRQRQRCRRPRLDEWV